MNKIGLLLAMILGIAVGSEWFDHTVGKKPSNLNAMAGFISYYCGDCNKDLGRLAEYATYHICGEKSPNLAEELLKSIPTWPEYIEMPEDLRIVWPVTDSNSMLGPCVIYVAKGTRIYFRKDTQ